MFTFKKILIGIAGILLAIAGVSNSDYIQDKFNKNKQEGGEAISIEIQKDDSIVTVTRVIDGDTFKVDEVRIRLIGIDSPEKGECYYDEAKDFLTSLVTDKQVRLQKDLTEEDLYGRLLRYIILPSSDGKEDDIFINRLILEEGFARTLSISPDVRYRDLFSTAQDNALREKKGIWGECNAKRPNEDLREQDDAVPPRPECTIKGNISEKGYGKIYLTIGCDNYNSVKIDASKGEQYFCSESEAESAGFRKATNCP